MLGSVPSPILFGSVSDKSCLLSDRHCDQTAGSCLYYDNHRMALNMLTVCTACKLANIVFGLLAWPLYRPVKDGGSLQSTLQPEAVVSRITPPEHTNVRLEDICGELADGGMDDISFDIDDHENSSIANLTFFEIVFKSETTR